MILNIQQYEYMPRIGCTAGVHILVQSQDNSPALVKNNGLAIDYGSVVNIAISISNVSIMETYMLQV